MQSSLRKNRSILFRTFETVYNLSLPAPKLPETYFKLAWLLLHKVIPLEAINGKSLTDLKGRDANNLIKSDLPSSLFPTGDELFFTRGHSSFSNEKDESDPDHEEHYQPFIFRINTRFEEFVGSQHIRQKPLVYEEDAVCSAFTNKVYQYVEGVEVEHLRLGIDLFHAHYFGFVGFAPQVTQTLLIEANKDHLELRINAERLEAADEIPLNARDIFQNLQKTFLEIFSVDVLADYIERLRS